MNIDRDVEKRTDKVLPMLAAFAVAKITDGCNCLGIQPKAITTMTVAAATSVRQFWFFSTPYGPELLLIISPDQKDRRDIDSLCTFLYGRRCCMSIWR
jgi:hypothetical protein